MNKNVTEKIRLYIPNEYREHYQNLLNSKVLRSDLTITNMPKGYVAVDMSRRTFGVFDAAQKFITKSFSYRYNYNNHQKIPRRTCLRHAHYINETAIYCGKDMFFHFGHFLLEGMSRVYPVLTPQYKNAKLVFVQTTVTPMPHYVTDFLRLLGVRSENIIVTNKSMQFLNLVVPDQSHCIDIYSSSTYGDILHQISDNAHGTKIYDKVYLSRAKLGHYKQYGEDKIQNIFAKNGYTVIYPETLPLEEQIFIAAHCTHMAGCAGTALHLASFMKPGGTVIQLKRNCDLSDNITIQHLINKTAGLNFVFVWASIEDTPSEHFTNSPQIIGVTPQMRQFFDDENFVYSTTDIEPDTTARAEYDAAMTIYQAQYQSNKKRKIKKNIIKLFTVCIPLSSARRRARRYLTNAWDCNLK